MLDQEPNSEKGYPVDTRGIALDSDGDGKLSEAELTTAQKAHMKSMHEAHGGMAGGAGMGMHHGMHKGMKMPTFEDIDLDGNGCISPEEFDKHHAEMHP